MHVDESWMAAAGCAGLTPLMFPGRGDHHAVTRAKAICDDCHVRPECLEWAMRPGCPPEGVIAGMTPRERRRLRRR